MRRLGASPSGGGASGARAATAPPAPTPSSPADPLSQAAEAYVVTRAASRDASANAPTAVVVESVRDETESVKLLRLRASGEAAVAALAFRPGQWVDFYAPGVPKPGGFSIASSPAQLATRGDIELAVKKSRSSACGHWIHDECAPGDEVRVRVGGRCFLTERDIATRPLLLVAGGIGIGPLRSAAKALTETLFTGPKTSSRPRPLRAVLLYSGKTRAELALASDVEALARESRGAFRCVFHLTGGEATKDPKGGGAEVDPAASDGGGDAKRRRKNEEGSSTSDASLARTAWASFRVGRIDAAALREALDDLERSGSREPEERGSKPEEGAVAFLCGPPAMSDFAEAALKTLGVKDVRLERWW